MDIPGHESREWSELVEGKKVIALQFLATRILVGRLVTRYKMEPSPAVKTESIGELHNFFAKNIRLPAVQADLNAIFGGRLT